MTKRKQYVGEVAFKQPFFYIILVLSVIGIMFPFRSASAEVVNGLNGMRRYKGKRIMEHITNTLLFDGDTIHVQADIKTGGYGLESTCFLLDENYQLIPCENHCGDGLGYSIRKYVTSPSNHTYAISQSGTVYRYTPHEEKKWRRMFSNSLIKIASGDYIGNTPPYYATNDTKLYELCLISVEKGGWQVFSYDFSTGEQNKLCTIEGNEMPILFTMPDGTLMAGYAYEHPFLRIHEDGKVDELFTSDLKREAFASKQCDSILYLEGKGYLLLVDGTLYQMDDEGKTTLINYAPPYQKNVPSENCLVNLPGRDAVGFLSIVPNQRDRVLNVIPFAPQEITLLRLGGVPIRNVDYSNQYSFSFECAHPGVKVITPYEYSTENFADIATLLTSKDSTCDLYLVHTTDDGLQRMVQKGYSVALDDVPELAEFGQKLYPVWRSLVSNDQGQLVGMPVAVGGDNAVGYWPSIWEEHELGELPTTYGEMLDCICRWEEEGKLQEFNLVGYEKDSFAELTDLLLSARAAYCASQNEPTVYSSDDLLALLHQLEKMRPILAANDQMHLTGAPAFWLHFSAGPTRRFPSIEERSMPLSLTSEQEAVVPRTLYVYIINPYSQHQAEAKEFLAMLAEKMDVVTRFGLVKSDAQGVEKANYAENIADAKKEYAFWKEELRMCIEDGNDAATIASYEEIVDDWADRIEKCEANRYDVIPEEADTYRRTMENVAVTRASGFALVKKNAQSTISAFNQGKISPEELCRKLDEVVRMWMMENE